MCRKSLRCSEEKGKRYLGHQVYTGVFDDFTRMLTRRTQLELTQDSEGGRPASQDDVRRLFLTWEILADVFMPRLVFNVESL